MKVLANRDFCPLCKAYVGDFDGLGVYYGPSQLGTVGDTLTMEHLRSAKRRMEHGAHAHLMEAEWDRIEAQE